jgi:hypothetical protein
MHLLIITLFDKKLKLAKKVQYHYQPWKGQTKFFHFSFAHLRCVNKQVFGLLDPDPYLVYESVYQLADF